MVCDNECSVLSAIGLVRKCKRNHYLEVCQPGFQYLQWITVDNSVIVLVIDTIIQSKDRTIQRLTETNDVDRIITFPNTS